MDFEQAKNWAIASHLSPLIVWLGVPFGNLLGPFLVYLFKKDSSDFVREHAKEALNFQITMTLAAVLEHPQTDSHDGPILGVS